MVRKEMSKTSLIPAEKKLAASKTRLKIMLQGLNRMCEESEKAVVIKGQLSLVEKLFQETDALQSAYEEALEAEEQQASMIEWSEYRLDFLRRLKGERERLTELKMPVFSGKVLDFPAFWDRFQGSVHSRTDWDDASKFAYLLSSLSGVALAAVEGMPSSGCDRAGIREGNLERQTVFRPVSGSGTQALIDEIQRHLRCLSALGKGLSTGEMTASEAFLPMLKERFPEEIRLAWDIRVQSASGVKGDLREFLEFAQVRTAARLAAAATSDGGRLVKRDESEQHEPGSGRQERHRTPQTEQRAGKANTTVLHMVVISSCPICDGGHDIATCEKFLKAEVHTRSLMAARCKLCFRCLQSGHRAKACKVGRKCTVSGCRGSYHRLLHRSQSPSPDQTPDALKSRGCMLIAGGGAKQVRLQSVRARAVGKDGRCMVVQCLLDPGSQSSIRMWLTLWDSPARMKVRRVEFHLESVDPSQSRTRYPIQALVLPKICGKIRQASVKLSQWPHLSNPPIADQCEEQTLTIDVLIGLDHYFNLVGGDVRRGSTGGPVEIHSQLGWFFCGQTNRRPTTAVTTLQTRVDQPTAEEASPKHDGRGSEQRVTVSVTVQAGCNSIGPEMYGCVERLFRITAYCQRFVRNCRLPAEVHQSGGLTVAELLKAERTWEGACRRNQSAQSTGPFCGRRRISADRRKIGKLRVADAHETPRNPAWRLRPDDGINKTLPCSAAARGDHTYAGGSQTTILGAEGTHPSEEGDPELFCLPACSGETDPAENGCLAIGFAHTGMDFAGPLLVRVGRKARSSTRPAVSGGQTVRWSRRSQQYRSFTPFHFLIGRPFVDIPMTPAPTRWRSEYITTFVNRAKWLTKRQEPKEGDIVLVKEDSVKRDNWPLGRITIVIPGRDGLSRTVQVKTAKGIFTRPVAKLYLLEPADTE
ncbi:hypothetical protein T10_12582 [Trichinella papuae]|uniref:CCHC-type domain-containing protein n=1 Tax=Trichinella papuae TaxID=268474 RepID=A0A0V1M3J2_9BILA|nr:hypothetical protein T10_12582 [Trichinella papuae]